jgi:hypothetical protein
MIASATSSGCRRICPPFIDSRRRWRCVIFWVLGTSDFLSTGRCGQTLIGPLLRRCQYRARRLRVCRWARLFFGLWTAVRSRWSVIRWWPRWMPAHPHDRRPVTRLHPTTLDRSGSETPPKHQTPDTSAATRPGHRARTRRIRTAQGCELSADRASRQRYRQREYRSRSSAPPSTPSEFIHV